jgi:hypothetical protein
MNGTQRGLVSVLTGLLFGGPAAGKSRRAAMVLLPPVMRAHRRFRPQPGWRALASRRRHVELEARRRANRRERRAA